MPAPSSSGSNFQKLYRPLFVNPPDLNDPLACSVDEVEQQEEDDFESVLSSSEYSEKEIELNPPTTTTESKKPPSISSEIEEDAAESKKPLDHSQYSEREDELNPPTTPESKNPPSISSEVEKDVEMLEKPLENLPDDEGDHMDDVESRNPLSETEDVRGTESLKDDERMDGVELRKSVSESEDEQGMVGVKSVKDCNEGHPITGFDSMKLSDSSEGPEADGMTADGMNMSDLSEEEGESTVVVEEGGEPSPEDKAQPSVIVEEEADPMKMSDSDDEPTVATEEDDPMVGVKLNKLSTNSSSHVDFGTAFEPRRSSRNAAAKNTSYANVFSSLKHINGKRKRAFQKDAVGEVRASIYFYATNTC
jgi:hypothetical protein